MSEVRLGQRIIRKNSVRDAFNREIPYSPREKFDARKLHINSIENAKYRIARNRSRKKGKESNTKSSGSELSKQVLMSIKKNCNELQKLDQSFKDVLLKIFQEYKERDDYKIDFNDFNDISTLLTDYNKESKDKTACTIFLEYITSAQLDNFKNNLERQKEFIGLITSLHDFKRKNDPAERKSNESTKSDFYIPAMLNRPASAHGKIRKNKSVKKKKGKGKKPSLRRKNTKTRGKKKEKLNLFS